MLVMETREDEFRLPGEQQFLADRQRVTRYLCQQNWGNYEPHIDNSDPVDHASPFWTWM